MTICKFYANGYCKFGNNCRFEHSDYGNRNAYSKTYNQPHHQQQQHQPQHQRAPQQYQNNYNQSTQHHSNRNHNQNSSFSFANTAHNIGSSSSTFSFNRAAEQLPSNKPPSSFSFNQLLQQVQNKPPPPQGFSSPFSSIPESSMDSDMNDSSRRMFINSPMTTFFGGTNPNTKAQSSFFQPAPFGQHSSPSFFGNAPPSAPTEANSSMSAMRSFFDKPQTAIFSSTNLDISKSQIYSQITQLTDEDRISFDNVDFHTIPLRPPPYEVCF